MKNDSLGRLSEYFNYSGVKFRTITVLAFSIKCARKVIHESK